MSLVGFQPCVQAHSLRFEVKCVAFFAGIYALFNLRYVTDGVGQCFKRAGDLLQKLAHVKIFEDHKDLIAAKAQFDGAVKKISSEQNMLWTNKVYAHIPELNDKTLDQIKILNGEKNSGNLAAFLEENQKRTYDQYCSKDAIFNYISQRSYSFIPVQTEIEINSRISVLAMNDVECSMFQEGIKNTKFTSAADLRQFVEYAEHSIKSYRQERNKKLITLCCSHLGCETGALKVIKPELIHKSPRKILEAFSAAAITRNSMNQVQDGMTEITVDNLLMACKQG